MFSQAEYTEEVAVSMWWFYICTTFWDLLRAAIGQLLSKSEDGLLRSNSKQQFSSSPYWFWFLVLYFSPVEDAAFPGATFATSRSQL